MHCPVIAASSVEHGHGPSLVLAVSAIANVGRFTAVAAGYDPRLQPIKKHLSLRLFSLCLPEFASTSFTLVYRDLSVCFLSMQFRVF